MKSFLEKPEKLVVLVTGVIFFLFLFFILFLTLYSEVNPLNFLTSDLGYFLIYIAVLPFIFALINYLKNLKK